MGAASCAGPVPFTAITVGALERGCEDRVVNWRSGPLAGRFAANGASAGPTNSEYAAPGASSPDGISTLRPSPTTAGVTATGPSGPTRQNPPAPCASHAPSASGATSWENVTTIRVPVGTSSWPSTGNAKTTPGAPVSSGVPSLSPHPAATTAAAAASTIPGGRHRCRYRRKRRAAISRQYREIQGGSMRNVTVVRAREVGLPR